ncbi:hypothetical protein DRQ25_14995 [Candidatus Fermentibacteria bacterium]|nr:MAG: hypothetical protein DRQ25_14995 [Candidatus Fermentibacteria bacterium]
MPQAIPIIITVAQVAMATYSAVNAVKALKDGNIMGAVMGGIGAYTGFSNIASSMGSSVASEGVGQAASSAAAQGTAEGISEAATGGLFEGMEAASGFESAALPAFSGAESALGAITGDLGTLAVDNAGLLESMAPISEMSDTFSIGDTFDRVVQGAKDFGNEIIGELKSVGSGQYADEGGNIFDSMGKLLSNPSVQTGLKAGVGLYAKKREEDAKKEIYKDQRDWTERQSKEKLARRSASPNFVPTKIVRGG